MLPLKKKRRQGTFGIPDESSRAFHESGESFLKPSRVKVIPWEKVKRAGDSMGRVHAEVIRVTGPTVESSLKASRKPTPSPKTLSTCNVFSPLKHTAQLKDNPNLKPTRKWKRELGEGGLLQYLISSNFHQSLDKRGLET